MRARKNAFDTVRKVGLLLPGAQAATKYDGSPVLKLRGCFMAGLATHRSAEPNTLVIRGAFEERNLILEEAPENPLPDGILPAPSSRPGAPVADR